jgi:hypothetical protein
MEVFGLKEEAKIRRVTMEKRANKEAVLQSLTEIEGVN